MKSFLAKYKKRRLLAKTSIALHKSCSILEDEVRNIIKAVDQVENKSGQKEGFRTLMTQSSFVKLSILDILRLYASFLNLDNEKEKNVIMRTIATHLAEFIIDVSEIVGKPSELLMKNLADLDKGKDLLKTVRILFNDIKTIHGQMKVIRNFASSHKDRDIKKQLEIIDNMNFEEIELIMAKIQVFAYMYCSFERTWVRSTIAAASK